MIIVRLGSSTHYVVMTSTMISYSSNYTTMIIVAMDSNSSRITMIVAIIRFNSDTTMGANNAISHFLILLEPLFRPIR
jgi:hypothetical protein